MTMGDTKEYIKGDKHVHEAGSVMWLHFAVRPADNRRKVALL